MILFAYRYGPMDRNKNTSNNNSDNASEIHACRDAMHGVSTLV